VRWLCFFQDTNGLVFRALPAALGALATPTKALGSAVAQALQYENSVLCCSASIAAGRGRCCAGVSVRNGYDVNSLAVPRRAKEAIGAIALLRNHQRGVQPAGPAAAGDDAPRGRRQRRHRVLALPGCGTPLRELHMAS
jgi:hypothetical protein